MARTIVVCSDGTGNTFDRRASNVTALVGLLALHPQRQIVLYDQGIGTTADRKATVDGLRLASPAPGALRILDAPPDNGFRSGWLRLRGQATGYGLKENVGELYRALAEEYTTGDRVFLFGFSRGAFTVRALAGLLYRCGLATADDAASTFEQAWALFQPMRPDDQEGERIRVLAGRTRRCPVHFLGVWDTVKSYGGLKPVILPHLRHNPEVCHVRHALALDERRAWFKATTWGGLDSDQDHAMKRLDDEVRERVEKQDVLEVWFRGAHSDIGGGGERHAGTARIALRWMTGEATAVENGLTLNPAGLALLAEPDPAGPPVIHPSWTRAWRAAEQVPRWEIDNSGCWPVRKRAWGSDGVRDPAQSLRGKVVQVHSSVGDRHAIRVPVRVCGTRRPGERA